MNSRLIIVLLLCISVIPDISNAQKRNMVLVGGALADDNADIYGKFVDLAGGVGVAKIGIITAASADPQDSADFYEDIFAQYGAMETYWIPVQESNLGAAFDPAVVQKTNEMTGLWFGGGDQARVLNSLFTYNGDVRLESDVMVAIRTLYESGTAVVGGTSAGTACQTGAVMIKGGLSYEALKYGSSTDSPHSDDLTYDKDGGIGLLPGIVTDSHFSNRGREGRLIRLLSDTTERAEPLGAARGVGVDENTALWIESDLSGSNMIGRVIGPNGVYFADVSYTHVGTDDNGDWMIDTVYTHYLRNGDEINMDLWSDVTFASYKDDLFGNEYYITALTSDDIFGGDYDNPSEPPKLTKVATSLMDSKVSTTTGTTKENRPTFELTFIKGFYTLGYGGYLPEDPTVFDISYKDLLVDMKAI